MPFLGELPICIELRALADEGKTGAAFDVPAARPYLEAIAHNLVANLSARQRRHPKLPSLPVL